VTAKGNLSTEDLCFTPAVELKEMLLKKNISPVELMQAFLERIDKINPVINAYCTLVPEMTLEAARKAESTIMQGGDAGLLAGLPVSIKDVVPTAGIRTTFGSKLFENLVPTEDALVVARLKEAGGIVIGKTNTPEFAAGGNTFNQVFGISRNPWHTDYTVGGSSGGAAAAVAAGIGPLAQGSDLGGSLREPASFCGVVGFRPSPGRVPKYPNELNWDNQSVQGPIARTIADTALFLDAMSGPDGRSPVSLLKEASPFLQAAQNPETGKLKIAWSDNLNLTPVEPVVVKEARKAVDVFRGLGCEVVEDCPDFSGAKDTALILRGVRFVALYGDKYKTDPEFKRLVNPLVLGNIEQGLSLSVQEIAWAHRQRSVIWEKAQEFFDKYDLLLTPTTPIPPFNAEIKFPTEIAGKPMEHYLDWAMLTYAITMTSHPAISVPCGWTEEGLPIGVQIVGRHHGEAALLRAAAAYEQAAPWADKRPPLG
jgi:Asp-tRNA(Asn)/Glu-tRNA(Gln) amidotransferase A subunit family amidase